MMGLGFFFFFLLVGNFLEHVGAGMVVASGFLSSLDEHLWRNHCGGLYLKTVSSKCSEQGQVCTKKQP